MMLKSKIDKNIHLGDKIMCCIILYNQSIIYNRPIKVSCDKVVKKIIKNLNFKKNLIISNKEILFKSNFRIKDFVAGLENTKVDCFTLDCMWFESDPLKIENFFLPENQISSGNTTFFQMDTRSKNLIKIPLTIQEQIRYINRYDDVCGIGGKNTIKNLPFKYKTGNFEEIIKLLKTSKRFIGVDSGMSHVAGVLGLPSEIIVTRIEKKDIEDICFLYRKMYPKTKIKGRPKLF
jgi:hypothetical protein